MVEISNIDEKCFARLKSGCSVLSRSDIECTPQCKFYKPVGCEDWIRREVNGEIWVIPPEEYERSKRNEQSIQDKRKLYWIIKSV